jgi:hypothetical protein
MASAELSGRVEKVVAYAPLCEMSREQRRDFHEGATRRLHLRGFAGQWQAAILESEAARPGLRVVNGPLGGCRSSLG